MNYRIRFSDGTVFPCAEGRTTPLRHVHTSDRDFKRFTLVGNYADIAAKFVDGISYSYEWDSQVDEETTEVVSQDYSEYNIAGEIIDTRDGNITVFMSKPTEKEVVERVSKTLTGGTIITQEKAVQLRSVIERAVSNAPLTNVEALTCTELFPEWINDHPYTTGERVRFNSKLYECVQSHTAQADWTPDVSSSLWDEVTIDPETGYDQWIQPTGAQDSYNIGDRVVFEGAVYESIINDNSWSPTVYPSGWQLITI